MGNNKTVSGATDSAACQAQLAASGTRAVHLCFIDAVRLSNRAWGPRFLVHLLQSFP